MKCGLDQRLVDPKYFVPTQGTHRSGSPALKIVICFILSVALVFSLFIGFRATTNKAETPLAEEEAANLPVLDKEVAIPETVMINSNNVRITAMGISFSDDLELSMLYENYSSEKLTFITQIITVDDYTTNVSDHGKTVEGNDKSEVDVSSVNEYALLAWGLRSIEKIQVECIVKDTDGEILCSKIQEFKVSDNPSTEGRFLKSLQASSSIDYLHEGVLYSNTGITIETAALLKSQDADAELCLELKNSTSDDIQCTISNITVNGLLIQGYINSAPWETVNIVKNSRYICYLNIYLPDVVQEHLAVGEIGEISFLLSTTNGDEEMSIVIPGRTSSIDTSGREIYNSNDVKIIYKGIYKGSHWTYHYRLEGETIDYGEEELTYYEMLLYVDNQNTGDLKLELASDSLFLNYKKVAFLSYQSITGHTCYENSGEMPSGYKGYIILRIDDNMENMGIYATNIEELEMKLQLKIYRREPDTRTVRLSF